LLQALRASTSHAAGEVLEAVEGAFGAGGDDPFGHGRANASERLQLPDRGVIGIHGPDGGLRRIVRKRIGPGLCMTGIGWPDGRPDVIIRKQVGLRVVCIRSQGPG